jgi:hypothetical protein
VEGESALRLALESALDLVVHLIDHLEVAFEVELVNQPVIKRAVIVMNEAGMRGVSGLQQSTPLLEEMQL